MVNTRSTNPEIVRPDFTARVTPPCVILSSTQSTPESSTSSNGYTLANMSNNVFGSPSVPNPSPHANIYPPLPNFPVTSGYSKTTPLPSTVANEGKQTPVNQGSRPSLVATSKGKVSENDQDTQAPIDNQVSALNDVVQEQLKSGGANLDSDLLKLLLIRNLTATGSQSLQVNQSASNVANQLKWQQLGKDLQPSLLIDGSNFPACFSGSLTDPYTN
ncbi:hypothetical protein PSTG_07628 [Puccinia striiformis f. sp. tritici PST-78]|uniref:Uncharacterized protein n=1 Tax=Puccinia striiformis f. sp. tritici PST-78 TaxID=1165861 RepID=A0A0L0VIW3_9BASI|nr:hypothetical protein PSTG_07628 [Puccinia striiformis f. sp. tritici PST-78]